MSQKEQNGIKAPKPNTKGGQVWTAADEISFQLRRPAEVSEVLERCLNEGMKESTIITNFNKWCKYWGLGK
jgi:hypothetical protein